MKTLAFLQNQWAKNPERTREIYERYPDQRRRLIAAYLFMGCTTGRRLRAAFGEDTCDQIVWEEVSPEIGGHASSVFPADPGHIRRALDEERPDVVLAFGKIASQALPGLWTGRLITGPHPAARGAEVPARLKAMAAELRALCSGA